MHIQDKLNELNINNIDEFNNLFDNPQVKVDVTFWGTRLVKIDGFEGSIPVDDISQKIIQVAEADPQLDQLTNKIRLSGLNFRDKVTDYYRETDKIVIP